VPVIGEARFVIECVLPGSLDQLGAEGFLPVSLVVGEEAVEVEVHVDGGKPSLVDFGGAVMSVRVGVTLDAPFTVDFPDEIHGFRDEDCIEAVGTWEQTAGIILKVAYCSAKDGA